MGLDASVSTACGQAAVSRETAQQQGYMSEPVLGSCQTENDTLGLLIKHKGSVFIRTSHFVRDHISPPSFSGQLPVITTKNKAVHSIKARNSFLEVSEQKKSLKFLKKPFNFKTFKIHSGTGISSGTAPHTGEVVHIGLLSLSKPLLHLQADGERPPVCNLFSIVPHNYRGKRLPVHCLSPSSCP